MTRNLCYTVLLLNTWTLTRTSAWSTSSLPPTTPQNEIRRWKSPSRQRRQISLGPLFVVSSDIDINDEVVTRVVVEKEDGEKTVGSERNIPYIVARGDGSTGGGGLPMPKSYLDEHSVKNDDKAIAADNDVENDEDSDLRRPKVSAEMPLG